MRSVRVRVGLASAEHIQADGGRAPSGIPPTGGAAGAWWAPGRDSQPGAAAQAPRFEGLESRLLLSGSGLEAATLEAARLEVFSSADFLPASSPAPSEVSSQPDSPPVGGASSQTSGFSPQPRVTVQVQTNPYRLVGGRRLVYAGGPQLTVLGTDGDDAITLSQAAAGITLTTAEGSTTYSGAFRSVAVYGCGGHDTIRLTYSVTANTTLYLSDGGSTVYDAGTGNDAIYGGSGGDTFIAIGEGVTRVIGGSGMDSFWVDGDDTVLNVSAAETAAGNVHVVSQFFGNVSMAINGQALSDPTLTSYASRYASFASQPLFTDGPGYTDIRQGVVGDCYFLAPLASLAAESPNTLRQAITSLGDGTYAVRFYRGGLPVYLRVDADLPVNSGGALVYARLSASGEMWAPLMEKAYAFFRTGAGSYGSLDSGWIATATTELTNRQTSSLYSGGSDQAMYDLLSTSLAKGTVVTAASKSVASGPIVASHGYMVQSVFTSNDTMYVTVYNPWGYDGSNYDSNSSDGLITLTVTQFQQDFLAAAASV